MGKNLARSLTSAEGPAERKDVHPLSPPAEEEEDENLGHREQQDGKDGQIRRKRSLQKLARDSILIMQNFTGAPIQKWLERESGRDETKRRGRKMSRRAQRKRK